MTGPVLNTFSSAEKFHCRTCRRSLWPQCHAAELRFWRRVAGFCGNFQFCEDWWSSVGRMEVGQTDQTGAVKKKWSAGEIDGKWVSKVKMRWWLDKDIFTEWLMRWLLINTLMRLLKNAVMWLLINTSLQSDWWGDAVRQGPNFLSLFPFGANIICFHFPSASKTTLK